MEQPAHDVVSSAPASLSRVRGWLRDLFDFCYPELCHSCRQLCETGNWLCPTCAGQLDALAGTPACDLCGLTLGYPNAPCPMCVSRGVPHYDRIIRLGGFDTPLREMVHHLKFHGRWTVGELLADRLLKEDRVESLLLRADCLLPVPLHGTRELARGFNQAEVIAARLLSRATGVPMVCPVVRTRVTAPQTRLHSRARRLANLKAAFCLREPDAIAGRRVVVVDDVMTTGATLQVLGRALRKARPASLAALVVAVAQPNAR